MQITFDEKTETKIKNLLADTDKGPAKILFDFDDGVGPLSKVGSCSINVHFRFVLVDPDMDTEETYNKVLESSVGDLLYKGYSEDYMNENMSVVVNPTYGNNILKSDEGVLDQNAEIIDFRGIKL
jgi:uncharacterized protein YqkB